MPTRTFVLSQDELLHFALAFEGFNIFVPTRQDKDGLLASLTTHQLEEMISRRPLGLIEASHLYDETTHTNLNSLLTQNKLVVRSVGGVEFYCSFVQQKGKNE
jgi:hypothetical protein